MSFRGIITLIHTNDPDTHNFRTESMEGVFSALPMVMHQFRMFGDPIDETQDVRILTTGTVRNVTRLEMDVIEFSTANSTYQLTITGSFDDAA